jgi:hypothetical protein
VAGSTCWFLEAAPVSVRFRAAEAESGSAAALACLAEAHLRAPVAGSPWQAVDSRERADGRAADSHEPEVDSLARAADFRAWAAALADSAVVHSHAPEADSRELAALSGSPELARSRAMAVDCRVPLVSQVELRSACWAAPLAAFLLRVAVADSRAALRLCWPVGLERASHSA